jgi:hypothetical protein
LFAGLSFDSGGFVVALVVVWRLWGFGVLVLVFLTISVVNMVLVLVWLWFWCWCWCWYGYGFGVAVSDLVLVWFWCCPLVFFFVVCSKGGVVQRNYERLVPINDGAIRVGCQYLSPKRCNFSPLRRRFCDVSFGLIN